MASITLTSGSTSRSIELLDEVNDGDAVNVHIGSKYAELTTDSSFAGDTPRLKFSKNGTDYWIRESFLFQHPDGVGDPVATPSGRTLQRHSSGKATIVTWFNYKDNQQESFAVLDAQYRSIKKWGEVAVTLPGHQDANVNGEWKLDGNEDNMQMRVEFGTWPCTMTDQAFYNLWQDSFDINTARYNTSYLVAHSSVHEAAHYCRTVNLSGVSCDLPAIHQLMIIAIEADQLDALDPTVSSYSHYAFGIANPYSAWADDVTYYMIGNDEWGWWASTNFGYCYDYYRVRHVTAQGDCACDKAKLEHSVVPILEL